LLGGNVIRLSEIVGDSNDTQVAARLHSLEHNGRIEDVMLSRDDMARRRLRVLTSVGTECAIALPREQRLLLAEDRAIVVRMEPERWLRLQPVDAAAALELGYFAGNMHWRVKFECDTMQLAMTGSESDYLARLKPFLKSSRIKVGDDG
jgi:urease accessory protein